MNWKQHKLLSISTVLFIILFLAGGFLLFQVRGGYVKQKQALKSKLGELDKLNKRTPFPNKANQEILEANQAEVLDFYQVLLGTMASNQVEPLPIEPAQFPTLLNGSLSRLRAAARTSKTMLPEAFSFGFKTYADGSLPNADHVARLTSQVQMIEALVKTVYDAGVEGLMEVERDLFDDEKKLMAEPRYTRSRSPRSIEEDVSATPESERYSSETISVVFTGTDQTIWNTLNALAAHDQFVVVTKVELLNPIKPNASAAPLYRKVDGSGRGQGLRPGAGPSVGMGEFDDPFAAFATPFGQSTPSQTMEVAVEPEIAQGPPLSHEERIVAGRELVSARITVKVYQFKMDEGPAAEETEPTEPAEGSS